MSEGRRVANLFGRLGLGLAVGGMVAGLAATAPFRLISDRAFDLVGVVSPLPGQALDDVVLVVVDEPSMAELGLRWPWPRDLHARLLEGLRAAGAGLVAFDVLMAEPAGPGEDAALARAIASGGPVLLAADLTVIDSAVARQEILVEPVQELLDAGALVGNARIELGRDGVARRLPALSGSLAEEMALVVPGGMLSTPPAGALMRWPAADRRARTVSYYQALDVARMLPPDLFRGRIALVGLALQTSPDPLSADRYATPRTLTHGQLWSGVEIQATAWANRASGRWITPAPAWAEPVAVVLAAMAVMALPSAGPTVMALTAGALALGALIVSTALLALGSLWLPPVAVAMAGMLAASGRAGLAFARERRERRFIRGAFELYLAPELVERLADDPSRLVLGGETRELTILFCDLRGFTTLSERLADDPQRLVRVINRFLGPMTGLVRGHGGTIDKYIGDCIMAFWNAPLDEPRHAERASRCALAFVSAMARINLDLADELQGLPPLKIGIGINTGRCVVGNVGSSLRFAYSALGDPVNLAARIESLTKEHAVPILVSEATMRAAGPGLRWRELAEPVTVKGKSEAVRLYALEGVTV